MNSRKNQSAGTIFLFLFMMFFVFIFPVVAFAGDATKDTKEAEGEKERDLGEWWERNALKYDPLPEDYLYHFELTYKYNRDTGYYYRDNHNIEAAFIFRKHRFTNYLIYEFDKHYSALYDSYFRDDVKHELHEDFRFALTKKLYASIGGYYEVDEVNYIEESTVYYAGFGYHLIDTDKLVLKIYGALGQKNIEYTYNSDYGFDDMDESMFYSEQSFKWYIMDNLAFKEEFVCYMAVNDTELYNYTLDLGITYRISSYFSIQTTYTIEYDNFIDPNIPSYVVEEIIKKDTSFSTGIKISF